MNLDNHADKQGGPQGILDGQDIIIVGEGSTELTASGFVCVDQVSLAKDGIRVRGARLRINAKVYGLVKCVLGLLAIAVGLPISVLLIVITGVGEFTWIGSTLPRDLVTLGVLCVITYCIYAFAERFARAAFCDSGNLLTVELNEIARIESGVHTADCEFSLSCIYLIYSTPDEANARKRRFISIRERGNRVHLTLQRIFWPGWEISNERFVRTVEKTERAKPTTSL